MVEGGGAERRRLQAECVQTLLCMVTEIEACKLILVPQVSHSRMPRSACVFSGLGCCWSLFFMSALVFVDVGCCWLT